MSLLPIRPIRTALLALAITSAPAAAQFEPGGVMDPVKAELLADVSLLAPGKPFTVALRLVHEEGWHTYYVNPGVVGTAPAVKWTMPDGFKAGELQFPVPIIGNFAGENFYGYEGDTWFLATITPPGVLPETVRITADASWLACKEQCIPGKAQLTLTLPSGADSVPNQNLSGAFQSARQHLPLRQSPWQITAINGDEHIILELVPGAGATAELGDVHLFSSDRQDDASMPQKLTELPGGGWRLEVPRATKDAFGDPIERLPHISGVLSARSGWLDGQTSPGLLLEEVPLTTDSSQGTGTASSESRSTLPLPAILGFMLLGGLILNLMPCVFPVIGLKIMGFVQQAGEDRAKIVKHGFVFTAGVLVSFWVISGLLFAAREAAGGGVGWGYQLQNPWVVLSLMLLMFILAMNMFGVFEIGASATGVGANLQSAHGLAGSFFSGVLATVVATPCSAPFLGAGIGAAIGLPAVPFFAAFTAMGLGLSLPYLLLSLFPRLIEKLPRPGPWMESFKQAMSFLLFATAGFLLWVYVGLVGLPSMLDVVVGLSAVGVAGWIYGRWHLPSKPKHTRLVALALTAVFAIGGLAAMRPPEKGLKWDVWSPQHVDELLADDRPVYVDFTAQWCLTCQLNKKRAYTNEVAALMKERGIVALKADNTETNPEINRAIRGLGRGAVPVNVLYVPGKDPIVTPELLSPAYLLDLFSREVPK